MNREATDLAGVRHVHYETLGSTNAEALAHARAGERGPLWITAATQTAGRGRRGNSWTSEPGNLFATLLLVEPSSMAAAPQISFVAALATHDAVTTCAPTLGPVTRLKWPNDLLIAGKKAAGLLLEGDSGPPAAVAVGIGINCASHPELTEYPATDLRAEGTPVDVMALLDVLAVAMTRRLTQWNAGAGFASIRGDWLARASGIGDQIRVRLPEREVHGRFQSVDAAGRLLLAHIDGSVQTITAGEVFPFNAGASR